jgi:hypothetical protein
MLQTMMFIEAASEPETRQDAVLNFDFFTDWNDDALIIWGMCCIAQTIDFGWGV